MNKTPTLGKTPTPPKTLSLEEAPNPEETLTPDKTPIPEETLTLEDKAPSPDGDFSVDEAPALGVLPEDEASGPKMVPPGGEASSLEKALMLSRESSHGDNAQLHPFPLESALPKSQSLLVSEAESQEEVHMAEERPLDTRDSSALQFEAEPGSPSALEKAHPPEDATTLLEVPAKDETTPKEEAPLEEVDPAQKNPHPVKTTPDPQETLTLHSLGPQNPPNSKSDRDDVIKLQGEVESLRSALELMGMQLE